MRILRNLQEKQGISVVVPQLQRMHLLVPGDHSCFVEAQHRRDMGAALVQVLSLHIVDAWRVTRCLWRAVHRKSRARDLYRRAMVLPSLAELLQQRANLKGRRQARMRMVRRLSVSASGTLAAWTSTGCVATAKLR
jgi:hypothetical protein